MVKNLNSKFDCTPVLAMSTLSPQQHEGGLVYYHVLDTYRCFVNLLELVQGDREVDEHSTHRGDAVVPAVPTQNTLIGQLRVAWSAGREIGVEQRPVVVMALDPPAQQTCWLYTTRDVTSVLEEMSTASLIRPSADFSKSVAGTSAHGLQYMLLQAPFDKVVAVPDSEQYIEAMKHSAADQVTPAAPSNALQRLQSWQYIRNRPVLRSLVDDRYANELEDWEIYIAERLDTSAAQYLEMRRRYFKRYHADVRDYRVWHSLGPDANLPQLKDWKNKVDMVTSIRPLDWGRRRVFAQSFDRLGLLDEAHFY